MYEQLLGLEESQNTVEYADKGAEENIRIEFNIYLRNTLDAKEY